MVIFLEKSFVSLYNQVHSAYYYYCARVHKPLPIDENLINVSEGYNMNEATDFRHVIFGKLSFLQWNKDRRNSCSFSLWYRKDLRPAFVRYWDLFTKIFKRHA